jgi:hypothetical protein
MHDYQTRPRIQNDDYYPVDMRGSKSVTHKRRVLSEDRLPPIDEGDRFKRSRSRESMHDNEPSH